MKLSERFDRRYQQTPAAVSSTPGAAPGAPTDGAVTVAPAERRIVPRQSVGPPPEPTTEQIRIVEPSALLSPTLAAAKGEIHAQLLSRHAAAIDINNRAGIRMSLIHI